MNALEILEDLVRFPTVFNRPNLDLIEYVAGWLRRCGVESRIMPGEDGTVANLWATIGGGFGDGGVCLSGHTDVVPVDDQSWSHEPFRLTREGDRLFGRGAADMKGFCAAVLARVPDMIAAELTRPIHICLTFGEEDGCRGGFELMPKIGRELPRPDAVIVGEPTNMRVVSGHKGMMRLRTTVTGLEAHSSRPDIGVSAIMAAGRMIAHLGEKAEIERRKADATSPFIPPYSTIHVGQIEGGSAPTIMAQACNFVWDIRVVPGRVAADILRETEEWVDQHALPSMHEICDTTGFETQVDFDLPGLRIEPSSGAEILVRRLLGDEGLFCVGYATEGGLFQAQGIDTVLCGPGAIDQAHKADEYITLDQMAICDRFLGDLIAELSPV